MKPKKIISLLIIFFLLSGLVAILGVVKYPQIFDAKASITSQTLTIIPATKTSVVGEIYTLVVLLNTDTDSVAGVNLDLSFDPNAIQVQSFTPGTALPAILKPVAINNGNLSVALGVDPPTAFKGSAILGTLTVKTLTATPNSIAFTPATIVASIGKTANSLASTTGVKINFLPGTDISIKTNGVLNGTYTLSPGQSNKVNFAGVNNGPVEIGSSNGLASIPSEQVIYTINGTQTSYSELIGFPANQVSDTYYFPYYNNVDLDTQLRFANVGTSATTITVKVAGTTQGTYNLNPSQSTRVSLASVKGGPVQISSSNSVPVTAAERVIYAVNGTATSFTEMMGLPAGQLTDTYLFPYYNNVDLDTQLRFGNVSTNPTVVTVKINGVVQGTYNLNPNQSTLISYAGINNGPVQISSSNGVPIVASERVIYTISGTATSYSELMGLGLNKLTDTYHFPWYNNVDLDTQLRFGNMGTASTDVTITVGGVDYGPYTLTPSQSNRISLPSVNNGPVKIHSTNGVPIIAAERVIYKVNNILTSFSEMMGLPGNQLTDKYLFPWYNNVDLNTELRFSIPQ